MMKKIINKGINIIITASLIASGVILTGLLIFIVGLVRIYGL